MGHRFSVIAAGLVSLAAAGPLAAQGDGEGATIYGGRVISQTYHVDRIYRSMAGPSSVVGMRLMETPERELMWIVGYRATVVDAETLEPVSQEFMCHANLSVAEGELGVIGRGNTAGRLFTLSQGQQEIRFPDGFGIPVLSDQRLILNTQVLNLNLSDADLDLKHSVEVMLVRDRELVQPMRPLFQRGVQVMKSMDEPRYFGMERREADPERHGASCGPGTPASDNSRVIEDPLGQRFTGHWVVQPGREVSRTNVTRWLDLQFDTTVHYIAVHLHPFADSLELFDLTEGRTVYKALTENLEGRVGLARVDSFSSEAGIPLYRDHEYEVVSTYDNTSGEPVDAMAVMFLYMLDASASAAPEVGSGG